MNIKKTIFASVLVGSALVGIALPSEAAPRFSNNTHFGLGTANGANCGSATTSYGYGFNNNFYGNGYGNGYGNNRYGNNGYGRNHFNAYGNINSREQMLSTAIQRGIQSGRLTQNEANKLMREQARVAQLEANLRVNGLSFQERQRLNNDLNRVQRDLRRELSDNDIQGSFSGRFW